MNIDFYAVNQKHLTFLAGKDVVPGTFVKISANGTVAPCTTGDKPIGICKANEGDCASIQLQGHCKITYTLPESAQVSLGYQGFVCSDPKTLKPDAAGREMLVLATDTSAKTADVLL